ncbi:MAG: transcription termination factor Rho [Thermoguttaceae bacterium]
MQEDDDRGRVGISDAPKRSSAYGYGNNRYSSGRGGNDYQRQYQRGNYQDRSGAQDRGGYSGSGFRSRNYRGGGSRRNNGYSQRTRYNPLAPKKPDANSRLYIPARLNANGLYDVVGVLELHPNGYGFLRDPKDNYVRHLYDPFVPCGVIQRLGLREGVRVKAEVKPAQRDKGPRVCLIHSVDGMNPIEYAKTPIFDDLVPATPRQQYRLETEDGPLSTRIMDILTPLGKGQRALVVAPPRSGKTVLLQQISRAVIRNYPETYVTVLLIDERPEEVTDFKAFVRDELNRYNEEHDGAKRPGTAEVVASSLDCELESHIRLAQLVTKRCQRLAEMGKDVFLLLDSITRLARTYNKWGGNTGRTMTGGLDIKAMDVPKKIFSSARQIVGIQNMDGSITKFDEKRGEKGGSITIVGTALVETGSRMDELIFQEFKGTGNMELVLDRRLADRRIWPAINVDQSGTRHEEKLLNPAELRASTLIRRTLSSSRDPIDAMERLSMTLPRFKTNADFFLQFLQKVGQ